MAHLVGQMYHPIFPIADFSQIVNSFQDSQELEEKWKVIARKVGNPPISMEFHRILEFRNLQGSLQVSKPNFPQNVAMRKMNPSPQKRAPHAGGQNALFGYRV